MLIEKKLSVCLSYISIAFLTWVVFFVQKVKDILVTPLSGIDGTPVDRPAFTFPDTVGGFFFVERNFLLKLV